MDLDKLITSLDMPNDEYIVVGVSSGPDSMALLHLLKKNSNKKIVCAHVNHNVRRNSIKEELYLKDYCEENNIIFESYKITSYNLNNFEAEARIKRYSFFEKTLKKYHSKTLFLAHHGDDLVETIIMKIIRGTNLEGYAGIKKYSKQKNYIIIRPLIYLTKDDIIKYNQKNKIKYYIDKTNKNIKYTRNRIRRKILPALKKEDKNIHLKFLKFSNTIQEYHNYIEFIVKSKIKTSYKNNTINIELFNNEDTFIKKQIIFYILREIYENKSDIIKNKHIDEIIRLSTNKKPNAYINLPLNYIAKKVYSTIYIEKNTKEKKENYKIILKDKIEINDFIIKKLDKCDISNNSVCRLNSKTIKLPIYIRNKKDGDYIEVLGLNGKKKISDIFIENKVPKDLRDQYPIVVDSNDNVLWIPNLKKSKYNVKKNELCDIILTSRMKGENEYEKKAK